MRELIKKCPIIAIMRNVAWEKTVDYTRAVVDGGIGAVEVALNSKHALRQLSFIKESFGKRLIIGAGTATSVQKVKDAVTAGADFLLSPSTNKDVLNYCATQGIKLLPGVMTPTDVSVCVRYGFTLMKLFPAGDLPIHYIKSLQGPFDGTNYVAVGGITKENVKSFFDAGFLGVGVGSNLIPQQFVEQDAWMLATKAVRDFVK